MSAWRRDAGNRRNAAQRNNVKYFEGSILLASCMGPRTNIHVKKELAFRYISLPWLLITVYSS